MVIRVLSGVLHNLTDIEDAFQATFLVLARKACSIREPDAVGSWLYGVALRVAANQRAAAIRRQSMSGSSPRWRRHRRPRTIDMISN